MDYEYTVGTDFDLTVDIPDLSNASLSLHNATEIEYTIYGSAITKKMSAGDITVESSTSFTVHLSSSDAWPPGSRRHSARVTIGGSRISVVFSSSVDIQQSLFA